MGRKNNQRNKSQKLDNSTKMNAVSDDSKIVVNDDVKSEELNDVISKFDYLSVNSGNVEKSTTAVTSKGVKPIDLSGKELNRDEVKVEREKKRLEKKMKKEAAKVKAPASDTQPKQQTNKAKNQDQSKQHNREKGVIKQNNKSNEFGAKQAIKSGKSALKNSSSEADKSNLQVRFDLQPIQIETNLKDLPKPGYKFLPANSFNVHPVFRRLAARCERSKITGINDLLREFYETLISYLKLFSIQEGESYKVVLTENIQPQFSCLSSNGRRPFPLAIGNLIRQFRKLLTSYTENDSEEKIKNGLIDWLEQTKYVNFELAERAISEFTIQKLKIFGEKNIMTYGRCPIVERVLLDAKNEDLNIHVYVIDNPAINSGKLLLENLSEAGISCTYGHINSIGYLMEHCNYVLMGSSAILSNGRVVASRGSSLLALLANSLNIPVLITAKTCMFVDKVRLDEHLSTALLKEPLETISEDLVTALVTDFRILPPTSAPAVLKAKKLGCD